MATTDEILEAAKKVGELVAEHDSAKKLEDVLNRLEQDTQAQRTLTDYNRHAQTLVQKQSEGKPIEVSDKRKLEELQTAVAKHPLLQELQKVQMDYVDLLRKVDEQIAGPTPTSSGSGAEQVAGSPLVNPDVSNLGGQG